MDKKQAELIRKEVERKKAEFCQAIEKIVPKLKKELTSRTKARKNNLTFHNRCYGRE